MTEAKQDQFKTVIMFEGIAFDSKAEAMEYARKPHIVKALAEISGCNAELANWLHERREEIAEAFEFGTIRRVSKSDYKKIDASFEALAKVEGIKELQFLQDNAAQFRDSFRWPAVKRLKPEEQAAAAREKLLAVTEGSADITEWLVANRAAFLDALEAGKIKREVSPAAAAGLQAYRERMAAQKAASDAAVNPADAVSAAAAAEAADVDAALAAAEAATAE